ncbi:MAG TPA: M23 family metallopeptidase, partial [Vicinamibacterales bacterium]|nr:M23 family metallopeptidase [Vicinamibacterales bacterium]
MSPNRKSRITLFRNPLTALALLYAVVLLGCAPEGTTAILTYHGLGSSRRHPGVDFAALVGDPVIAAADGVVVQAGFEWGCGNGVSIE